MGGSGKQSQQGSELARRSPPSYERRMYSPHSIAAIVAELVKEGGDATVVLEGTGLGNSQLHAQTTRISYRQLDIVIQNALRPSDPAIALRAGLRMHITAYGMYDTRY